MPDFTIEYKGQTLRASGGEGQEYHEVFLSDGKRLLLDDTRGIWKDVVKGEMNEASTDEEKQRVKDLGAIINARKKELGIDG